MGFWVYFPEGRDGLVSGLRRATALKIDDGGTQQFLKEMRGLASEQFTDVYRAQSHGLSSHPPAGSEGLFAALGGRSDRLLALGFEHPDHRPKDLPEGAVCLYDADKKTLKLLPDKVELDANKKDVVIRNAKEVTIKEADKITATATTRAAIGCPGNYVSIKPKRIDIAVKQPDDFAPCKVMTECGLSNKVFAVVDD